MRKKEKTPKQKSTNLKAGSLKNKIDKALARLIKKQREKNQINKIRSYNRQHRNTKDHKRLPSATICQ